MSTWSGHSGSIDQVAERGHAGRIGPNAVSRLAEALLEQVGELSASEIFHEAGELEHLHAPPAGMVDERSVTRLHAALRRHLDVDTAACVARRAGELTGNYLLEHRIPKLAQALLRVMPASVAAPILVRAIRAHAWTFSGSGSFGAIRADAWQAPRHAEPPSQDAELLLTIRGCPLCRGAHTGAPACSYFASTFEHLFRSLVRSRTSVREVACEGTGAPACTFEVRW